MHLSTPSSPKWDATLPRTSNALQLSRDLESWIYSDTLHTLAAAWGGVVPYEELNASALYKWFDDFSQVHWDFRDGSERNFEPGSRFSPDQLKASRDAANAFGMVEVPGPSRRAYDYVLILGGLARACLTRTQHVADLVASGLKFKEIVALGGARGLGHDEVQFLRRQGLNASSEFEAMVEGVKRAFGISGGPDVCESSRGSSAFGDWAVANFSCRCPVSVIAAPSTVPAHRRANTADTFTWWGEREGSLEGKHVLVVTTAIYVPYQSAVAVEKLGIPHNASIETVGVPFNAPYADGRPPLFSPDNYLQEVRSTIRSYRSLYDRLSSPRTHHGKG